MFHKISKFLMYSGRRHHHIKEKTWYKKLLPYYVKMRSGMARIDRCLARRAKPDESSIAFYTAYAERVNAIAGMLADERSKSDYLGIIAYRQSRREKDYPFCNLECPEYFIEEMALGEDEVLVDCGAYIGDTIDAFVGRCPRYKRIIAFEPDRENFKELKQKHGNNPKIMMFNAGVYDIDGEVRFAELGELGSSIGGTQGKVVTISVKTIDGLNLDGVSFLKMDIEGAELKALKGAQKTIMKHKPKLAISIYHSNDDMLCIAEYIHALIPEYQLFVRHHAKWPSRTETVLYARMPLKGECQ